MEAAIADELVREENGARRILCVYPSYRGEHPESYKYSLALEGFAALMPPLGLLIIAAALPSGWQVRFIDENIRAAASEDFAWADVVLVSGLHTHQRQMKDICRRAHLLDRVVVLGGPSVSACPEYYPEFDYLHIGELGDATDELFERLRRDRSRPKRQVMLSTRARRDLADFPLPAYELAELDRYLTCSIQFSSGCPYECEFCDIPSLYGRVPRLNPPARVLAALDKILASGRANGIFFVDDNFIGNRRATRELLPHLIAWQERNDYPFALTCEATLNIAKRPEILELMRQALFVAIYCGIETPDPHALEAMAKGQNRALPILKAVETINSYGIEIASGIILGLDTDTLDTGEDIVKFAAESQIPIFAINLLQALPRTPLWDRLQRDERIVIDEQRESNVVFRLPYEAVLAMWRDCIRRTFEPAALYARFEHQACATYPNRIRAAPRQNVTWKTMRKGLVLLGAVLWRVGIRGDYRCEFWKFACARLVRGEIVVLLTVATVADHAIRWAREVGREQRFHLWRWTAAPPMGPTAPSHSTISTSVPDSGHDRVGGDQPPDSCSSAVAGDRRATARSA